ncbi:MAG: hypothetical protein ABSF63_13325 [Candidatus Bathyarchaeia archaeon]
MIPKPALVTGLLLVVAVLAFAGLGYEQVPMSTTQSSTEPLISYSPYMVEKTKTSTIWVPMAMPYSTQTIGSVGCFVPGWYCTQYYFTLYSSSTTTLQNTLTISHQNTATISYSRTVTASFTSLVPASAALELTGGSFIALAVAVIGILALLTAYATLKTRTTHN